MYSLVCWTQVDVKQSKKQTQKQRQYSFACSFSQRRHSCRDPLNSLSFSSLESCSPGPLTVTTCETPWERRVYFPQTLHVTLEETEADAASSDWGFDRESLRVCRSGTMTEICCHAARSSVHCFSVGSHQRFLVYPRWLQAFWRREMGSSLQLVREICLLHTSTSWHILTLSEKYMLILPLSTL